MFELIFSLLFLWQIQYGHERIIMLIHLLFHYAFNSLCRLKLVGSLGQIGVSQLAYDILYIIFIIKYLF